MRLADILVDLALVAGAARSVASKHVALRAGQVERYGQTSGVASALRQQRGQKHAPVNESEPEGPVVTEREGGAQSAEGTGRPDAGDASSTRVENLPPRSAPIAAKGAGSPASPALGSAPSGKPAFVPAPWANGVTGFVHQTPAGAPPRPPRSLRGGKSIMETLQEAAEEAEREATDASEKARETVAKSAAVLEERVESVTPGSVSNPQETSPPERLSVQEEPASPTQPASPSTPAYSTSGVRIPPEAEDQTSPKLDSLSSAAEDTSQPEKKLSPADLEIAAEMAGSSSSPAHELRESRVPATRIGRIWNYGGLAAGMLAGAMGEGFSRALGGGGQGSIMLSPANMERLVAKLSRMRGAALKIGQQLSFQDSKMLPPAIGEVLQRVQDRADYMPAWQRDKVLVGNLGPEWRKLFDRFDEKPIAAASIGQVHRATLKSTGEEVAVKIQFPGVADSINSDLDNLGILLTATKLLPKGLYLNKTIDNARTELAWECDYLREAECGERYRQLLADEVGVFVVPRIYPEACGKQVLTMEFMEGVGVTRVKSFTQEQKDWIGTQILRLCLREITEFKFMQTDPNWTNFLYNAEKERLELLDFGASRQYPVEFIDPYVRLLEAASRADRDTVKALSEELGYLTGHESKAMLDAHITSILTLAEPFMLSAPAVYDFRDQTITERVKAQIPVMLRERLAPPPEETYSLHRKLSGAFLLCARLGSRVKCRELFEHALEKTGYLPKRS